MKEYYIALEPAERLSKMVTGLKRSAKNMVDDSSSLEYADDPTHITLCIFRGDYNKVIRSLDGYKLDHISVDLNRWKIFKDDIFTGYDTVVCNVLYPDFLRIFQGFIINNLCSEYQNHYPYKCKKWIPHVTIASMPRKYQQKFRMNYLAPCFKAIFDKLTIREVGTNKLIKRWKLN